MCLIVDTKVAPKYLVQPGPVRDWLRGNRGNPKLVASGKLRVELAKHDGVRLRLWSWSVQGGCDPPIPKSFGKKNTGYVPLGIAYPTITTFWPWRLSAARGRSLQTTMPWLRTSGTSGSSTGREAASIEILRRTVICFATHHRAPSVHADTP